MIEQGSKQQIYPTTSPTVPYVQGFADRMEAKLAKNRHKGDRSGWLKDTPLSLRVRIDEELAEFDEAFDNGTPDECVDELADVANFCMMLADNILEHSKTKQ